jgi:hypothetical protein
MRLIAAVAMISLFPLSAAVADVYRSLDPQGHVLYSDTPTPGAELVRTGTHGSLISTSLSKPAGSATPKSDAPPTDASTADAASRAVQTDVAQTRADQCKKAKDAYEKSVLARRIYNVAPDGSRQYLSDADAEQARVNNKLQMDDLCK